MARKKFLDFIQSNKFTIFDASNSGGSVLSSLIGCQSCTIPSTTVENRQIKEGNKGSKKSVYKTHDYSNLVIERGTSLLTSDFYDWIDAHINGIILPKKLMIICYSDIDGGSIGGIVGVGAEVLLSSGGLSGGLSGIAGAAASKAVSAVGQKLVGGALGIEKTNDYKKYIPAKGWMVEGCVPASYEPGALNATSSDVLIQRLELEVEKVTQIGTNISL